MSLELYQQMGFEQQLAERAFAIFGNEIQGASEYMLRQSTLGQMPKKFKLSTHENGFNYTFYRSTLDYAGGRYIVADYDSRWNIIEIEPWNSDYENEGAEPRWLSLADPAIRWGTIYHYSKPVFKPVEDGAVHKLGDVYLPLLTLFRDHSIGRSAYREICRELNTKDQGDVRIMWSRCVRRPDNKKLDDYWSSLLAYTDKNNGSLRVIPQIDPPPSPNTRRIRHARAKAWTKMNLILEINGVAPEDATSMLLGQEPIQEIMDVVGILPETVEELDIQLRIYDNARFHLRKEVLKWYGGCSSIFKLKTISIRDGIFHGEVSITSNAFTQSMSAEARYWLHQKRIFNLVSFGQSFVNDPSCLADPVVQYRHLNDASVTLKDWGNTCLDWCKRPSATEFGDMWPHQTQALNWMLEKEHTSINPLQLPYGWSVLKCEDGFKFLMHELGNITIGGPPGLACESGILSQPSGSGKTRTVLALIEKMKQNVHWRLRNDINLTLIVVQSADLLTWKAEFSKWAPDLNLHVYHGQRRSLEGLSNADVLLTTQRVVCSELSYDAPIGRAHEFQQIEWRRMIVDNGHLLRDESKKLFRACSNITMLPCSTKWILTSSPIMKSFVDITSYFNFLQIYPWDHARTWHDRRGSSVTWSLLLYCENFPRLRKVLKDLLTYHMFHQDKETIRTSHSSIEDCRMMLTPSKEHEDLLNILKKSCDLRCLNGTSKKKINTWLKMCAISPSTNWVPEAAFGIPVETRQEGSLSTVKKTVENLNLNSSLSENFKKSLFESLKKSDGQCPICLDIINDTCIPTITNCGHLFCSDCINSTFKHQRGDRKKCPVCRTQLQNSVLHEIATSVPGGSTSKQVECCRVGGVSEVAASISDKLENWVDGEGSKNGAIQEWLFNNPQKKVIIVSKYKLALEIIKNTVESCGEKCAYVFGVKTTKEKQQKILSFQNDDTIRVFVTSSKTFFNGGLTTADTIIFYEPFDDKKQKDANISRIDRFSQSTKQLKIITLVVKGSVEEELKW